MKPNKILLTGYKNINDNDISPSKEMLAKINNNFDKFLFTNDFNIITKEVDSIIKKNYDYIIMFGWKPLIKDLRIELLGKSSKDYYFTNMKIGILLKSLKDHNIKYKLSENAGNSYCNFAYYEILKSIYKNKLNTKVIFIHIPNIKSFIQMSEFIKLLNNY